MIWVFLGFFRKKIWGFLKNLTGNTVDLYRESGSKYDSKFRQPFFAELFGEGLFLATCIFMITKINRVHS